MSDRFDTADGYNPLTEEETVADSTLPDLAGLTGAEAERRLAERGPVEPPPSSRTYASIVRHNVFNVFNLILAIAGIITLIFGDARDALFLVILLANITIGLAQEIKAKRALDRLAALVAPAAVVIRDGAPYEVPVEDVLVGDLVQAKAGDQIIADGEVVASETFSLDESILTGESRPVKRMRGDEVRSGSFAVEGYGYYTVEAVGADSYAERIAGEARTFRHPRSPLERAVSRLLFALIAAMVVFGAILTGSLIQHDREQNEAVETAVAAALTLVPEGLILLVSLTFAVSALRMARRGALAQQLNAIESLASAEIVCLDKTGTLTEPRLRVVDLIPAPEWNPESVADALGRYAASSPSPNATLEAIAGAFPSEPDYIEAEIPFSSRRRWSALRLGSTNYVMGAPELFSLGFLADRAQDEARAGRRVVALGTTSGRVVEERFPSESTLLGVVVLAEELRDQSRETVEYFLNEDVELKVISGDAPETVASIAEDAGIPLKAPPVDGTQLPTDEQELQEVALASTVVGRISPEGKRSFVQALNDAGKYVAMVGDGVNDVPALKSSKLGIAQASGSQMAKTVADVVLVHGDFASVPPMVNEGRKILRNLQRVSKLFVTKSVVAAFLILTVGLVNEEFPFLPRHLTLAAAVAVGIPAFFLALAPSKGAWKPDNFLRDVARFSVPAGTAMGLGVVSAYLFALNVANMELIEARTVATSVLTVIGLYLIVVLEAGSRIRSAAVGGLVAVLFALYLLALVLPFTREFFELSTPNVGIIFISAGGVALSITGLWLTGDRFIPGRAANMDA